MENKSIILTSTWGKKFPEAVAFMFLLKGTYTRGRVRRRARWADYRSQEVGGKPPQATIQGFLQGRALRMEREILQCQSL